MRIHKQVGIFLYVLRQSGSIVSPIIGTLIQIYSLHYELSLVVLTQPHYELSLTMLTHIRKSQTVHEFPRLLLVIDHTLKNITQF